MRPSPPLSRAGGTVVSVPVLTAAEPPERAGLGEAEPGVGSFAVLATADPATLTEAERGDLVVAAEKLLGFVTARQAEAMAALSRPATVAESATTGSSDWTVSELSAALRVSETTVRDRLMVARTAVDQF